MPKRDVLKRAPRHRFFALNDVRLTGHVTHDPQMRYAEDGTPVCAFQVGVARLMSKGRRRSSFIQIVAFRSLAVRCSGLRKGLPVYIAGALEEQTYMAGGRWTKTVKIIADDVFRMTEDESESITLPMDETPCEPQTRPRPRTRTPPAAAPEGVPLPLDDPGAKGNPPIESPR